MKLHLLLVYVALLCIGTMSPAVAKPWRSSAQTPLKPPSSEMSPFSQHKGTDTSAVARDISLHSAGLSDVKIPWSDSIPNQKDKGAHPLQPVKDIPRLSELATAHTSAQWLTQSPPTSEGEFAVVEVRGVRLNPTKSGLEVILETTSSQHLLVSPSSSGNTFVANINNAQLALPEGKAFRSNNPVAGITAVTVIQQGANSIRVTVIGTASVPTAQVVQLDRTLVLGLTPAAETPSEPIEVVSTAKQELPESGYKVPSATTGTRIDAPIRDIPQSIQVIPRRIIEDRQLLRPDELGENVSGVQPLIGLGSSSSCLGASSGYYLRGFYTYETLRNGFRQFSLISPQDVANVDRVEFFKGPAAVLYGNGFSPGGIVNTVTKKPLNTPFYNPTLTVGNYSCYRPTLDIAGPLTSDRSLLYRLNASYTNSGSFRDFVNGNENYFVAPALTWRLGAKTTLSTEVEYLHSNFLFDSESFPLYPEVLRIPTKRFLGEPGLGRSHLDSTSITYNFEHKFSDNWKFRQGFNAFIANLDIGSRFYPTANSLEADRRTLDRTDSKGPQSNENYTLQNDISGNFNTGSLRHKVLFGLELSRYIYGYDVQGATLAPIDIFRPKYGARPGTFTPILKGEYGSDILGIYLQDLVEILPNLKLLAGGRFDLNDSYSKDRVNAFTNRLSDNQFSPRVGVVYQPIKSTSLYFNWSNSFAPQFFGQSRTSAKFKPEVGEQFEVGIKQDLLKKSSLDHLGVLPNYPTEPADTRPS